MLELVIAVSVITVFITAVAYSYSVILRLAFNNTFNIKAAFILEETVEAVKFLKTANWDENIAVLDAEEDYFLHFDGSNWQVVSDNVFIDDIFERKFSLENVNRDSQGKIVEPPNGNLDSGTRKLTVVVSWQKGSATTTKSFSTYIADL